MKGEKEARVFIIEDHRKRVHLNISIKASFFSSKILNIYI